ncbi:MAG: 50S ribosomal protein L11 methyltransferase [Syntrophales bacterium]|nr:50S ribosomal protein L11 methyltransferase [Syntrophales bacterium]
MTQQKDKWVEIGITVPEDLSDAISNFVTEIGAQGVYEESLEPQEVQDFAQSPTDHVVKAYLPQDMRLDSRLASLDAYITSLAALFPEYPKVTYSTLIVNDADWAEGWKKYFKPIRVTKNIIIKPTWERYAPAGRDIVIDVDPGMAFGTGQHASTRMCLEALEGILLHEKAGKASHVLDVGSGTGILGIAAAKLGAEKVTCVDIDKQATDIASENVKINQVEDRVKVIASDVTALHDTFDLIVANLTSKVLIKIRPHLISLLEPGAFLIMSGIIEQNREDMESHFFAEPFITHQVLTEKEWICYILKKEEDRR